MPRYDEVLAKPYTRTLMLGNVAIARGFLEAGVQFVSAYPGTPSTEIVEALAYASKMLGGVPYVEWSVNEKVAVEAAVGAAIAGAKSVAVMKHVGVNVGADPLFSVAYTGVKGGFVVVSADDPWMWSSQNEQDNRWYGLHAYIPVVEPTGVQDALKAAKYALEYSVRLRKPFMLRSTTRISHVRAPIETGPLPPKEELKPNGVFEHDPSKWTLIPEYARRHKVRLLDEWEKLKDILADFPLNGVEGTKGQGIAVMASGIGYRYALEALRILNALDKVLLVKLATPVPLPRKLGVEALEEGRVLVVEEGDPVVEYQLKAMAIDEDVKAKIYGKNVMPKYGELRLEVVVHAIARLLGVEPPSWAKPHPPSITVDRVDGVELPPRPPVLCAGCPYRPVFYALRRASNRLRVEPIFAGDIGCYSLGILPPFRVQDIILEMGGSIGAGNGIAQVVNSKSKPVVAIIGDSTFFHSGITPLLNAVYNRSPLLVLVLDNGTTAMTGHQPHPGVGLTAIGDETFKASIEDIARAVGVEYVEAIDAYSVEEAEKTLTKAMKYVIEARKPAVVVARGSCMLLALSEARRRGIKPPTYVVDLDKCKGCGICYKLFNCPAIIRLSDGKAAIDPAVCSGCGVCTQICPLNSFRPVIEPSKEWISLMRSAKPRV